jgi:hypothetical protein
VEGRDDGSQEGVHRQLNAAQARATSSWNEGGLVNSEELMARYGMQRALQGTDPDHSLLLAGDVEKPRVDFDLLNWQPAEDARPQ